MIQVNHVGGEEDRPNLLMLGTAHQHGLTCRYMTRLDRLTHSCWANMQMYAHLKCLTHMRSVLPESRPSAAEEPSISLQLNSFSRKKTVSADESALLSIT